MPSLLITGASARAIAQSALRANASVVAADLYADADLRAICEVDLIREYAEIKHVLETRKITRALNCGGLEREPELIRWLEQKCQWLGTSARGTLLSKNPLYLQMVLRQHGLPFPKTTRIGAEAVKFTRTLKKPTFSSGGRGIGFVDASEIVDLGDDYFYQEFHRGDSGSALFFTSESRTELLGYSRQLIGVRDLGAASFAYSGSVAGERLAALDIERLEKIGTVLSDGCQLRGIWGLDTISTPDGIVPIEVNPRVTASVELLEIVTGVEFLGGLLAGGIGDGDRRRIQAVLENGAEVCWAKGIVYCGRNEGVTISEGFSDLAMRNRLRGESRSGFGSHPQSACIASKVDYSTAELSGLRLEEVLLQLEKSSHLSLLSGTIADIPSFGTQIPCSAPMFTVYAQGRGFNEAVETLIAVKKVWETLIFAPI